MMSTPSSTFSELIRLQVERLSSKTLPVIEKETIAKRNAWWDLQLANHAERGVSPSPRFAFESLFFRYMGLSGDELPVLYENENEIHWLSKNPCPTLEACKWLGLETKKVCRGAYEKSTQAFLSRLDPQLRFMRSYEEIRPTAAYCREGIVRVPFDAMMRVAIEEAKQSRQEGNKGYGAVAVLGNRILARSHDLAITRRDPSLHAEMNVLREAANLLGDSNLSGVVLFSTCEPCPMCAAMAVWSNISAIVFGASIEETAAAGKQRIRISAKEIIAQSPVWMEVVPGVLGHECMDLYR